MRFDKSYDCKQVYKLEALKILDPKPSIHLYPLDHTWTVYRSDYCCRTTKATYKIGSQVPDSAAWLEALAGSELTWLRAFLTSTTIIQGNAYIDNPIRRLLAPRAKQQVVVDYKDSVPVAITLYGSSTSQSF